MPATAAGLTELMPALSPRDGFENPFERVDNGLPAHALAVAGKMPRLGPGPAPGGPCEAHHADRLLAAAAAGAGDAGHRQRDRALAARERAPCHLERGLLADRAVILQSFGADSQELLLGRVRVRDEAAPEPGRRAGDGGHRLRHPAAGAGLGGHQHGARALELVSDLLRQLVHQNTSLFASASASSVYAAATRSSSITPNPPP